MINTFDLQALPAIFLRIMGVMVFLPFSHTISNLGKVFAISFCLSIFFMNSAVNGAAPDYAGLIFEFLTGIIISIPSALTIDAARSLGELFDNQRGVSFAAVYDPSSNQQSSVMSHLSANFCAVLIVSCGILENILAALSDSFRLIPLYSLNETSVPAIAVNMAHLVAFICQGMFKSFLLCALVFVLADIASVFLSKVLNQAGLNQEVFLVKTLLGFMILLTLLKADIGTSVMYLATPNLKLAVQSP